MNEFECSLSPSSVIILLLLQIFFSLSVLLSNKLCDDHIYCWFSLMQGIYTYTKVNKYVYFIDWCLPNTQ